MPDIDIDVNSNFKPSSQWVKASINNEGKLTPHNSGYYTYSIPNLYPFVKLSLLSYDVLDNYGIDKVDFLKNNFYNNFKFQYEIDDLYNSPVPWANLSNKELVSNLSHVSGYYDQLQKFNISSLDDMADFLSLLRPGKCHLISSYLSDIILKEKVRTEMLYSHTDSYYYKKSHAYAYALLVSIQIVYYSRKLELPLQ